MTETYKNGVVILDFGSQYTKLIARRVREQNVYSIIMPPNTNLDRILYHKPSAIILSGGPSNVYEKNAPVFDHAILETNVPVLGICYGLQILTKLYGGE